ncbi:hypothetical protein VE02_07550 [Pseudogymnoascus sp. 03VT05]|nr:hypothetical protein VE02_07550 [Pseudogymnoascus sp. 03VT05]
MPPTTPNTKNQAPCPGQNRHTNNTNNSSGGDSCTPSPHPTIRGTTYCSTHQTICLLCPTHPRRMIGKPCKSCTWRERAEKRAAEKAEKAEREAEREAALEAAEQQRAAARKAAGGRSDVRTAGRREAPRTVRRRRGMNRRGRKL